MALTCVNYFPYPHPQRFSNYTTLVDEGGDVTGGGDIEGGVGDIAIRGNADAPDMGDLFGGSLLDGDFGAGFQGGVDGGGGGSDINGTPFSLASTATE